MSPTNKPIELLLALNVAEGHSQKNIQTYINKLQKDLHINVELQYSINSSAVGDMINSLQTALQALPVDVITESITYGLQDTYEQILQVDTALTSLNTTWSALASQSLDGLALSGEFVVVTQGIEDTSSSSKNLIDVMGNARSGFSLLGSNINDMSGAFTTLIGSATAAKTALKGLVIATGVGLAFAALDFVIGKTVSTIVAKMGEAKRKSEELAAANRELLNSYSQNEAEIDSLMVKYEQLSNKMDGANPDNKTIAEYRDIQNEIAQLLPSIMMSESAYGDKIVSSYEALKIKVDLLKEGLAIEKEKAALQDEADRNSRISENITEFDNVQREINGKLKTFANANTNRPILLEQQVGIEYLIEFSDKEGNLIFDSVDKLTTELLPKLENKLAHAKSYGTTDDVDYLEGTITLTKHYIKLLQDEGQQLNNLTRQRKLDYITDIESIIAKNNDLADNSKELASTFSAQLLNLTDSSNFQAVHTMLAQLFTFADYSSVTPDIIRMFHDIENASEETFSNAKKNAEDMLTSLPELLKAGGLSDKEISSIMPILNQKLADTVSKYEDLEKAAKRAGISVSAMRDKLRNSTEVDNFKAFSDELRNITSEISNINKVLDEYNSTGSLTNRTIADLISKYPSLITYIDDEKGMIEELIRLRNEDIEAAQQQVMEKLLVNTDFYKKNLKLFEDFVKEHFKFYQGDLDEWTNLAQAKADIEVDLINSLAKEWGVYYDEKAKMFSTTPTVREGETYESMAYTPEELEKIRGASKGHEAGMKAFDNFIVNRIVLDFNALDTSTEKSTSTAKNNNKTTKESIYLTDEYAQAIRRLNGEIAKQQHIRNSLPKHSEAYRQSLQAQIKLEQEKLALQEEQAKALERQIATGQIKKTGNVTVDNSSTTNQNLSGWNGRITSNYGNRVLNGKSEFHRGVDIAMSRGTRLDANIGGKVIASGSANSQGYHSSYGNIVVVQDENGMKHIYAHLEQAIAKVGETISAGTQIGTIGSTGRSTGPHLHYEINVNGKTVDPTSFLNDAKNGIVAVGTNTHAAVSTSQESIDSAKAALDALRTEMLGQEQTIADLQKQTIDSYTAKFDDRRKTLEDGYAFEEAKLKNINRDSSQYNATLNKQIDILKRKQNVDKEQIAFYEELIQQGGLSQIVIDELNKKIVNLKTSVQNSTNEIGHKKLDNMQSARNYNLEKQDQVIEYEKAKIQELDKNSERYVLTLEKMNKHTNRKMLINQKDLDDLNKLIASGEYSGEVLKAMKDDANALSISVKNLAQEISNNNFEIVANIKTRADERVDDISDQINVLKTMRSFYEEGSAEYRNSIEEEIKLQQKLVEIHDKTRRQQAEKLKHSDLSPEDLKKATEMLEEVTAAYWNASAAVNQLHKSLEKMRENIADKVISAYKEYVQERRDEHINMIDKELEKEQEASDKRKKAMKDELDLFRESIQAKLKLLDRQEAGRSYQMEIDELESERNKIVDQMNLLALDNSHEAKSKRKQLQEQLDNIDKNIAEKRHSRDIDLQKEALNDLLSDKEDDIREREELEDEQYKKNIERIEKEKAYWQKHYNDLLNDERKFAQIREDISKGHFEKVVAHLNGYITEMEETMPLLANTLDGTMEAVGISIRENVIDNLKEALKLINEYTSLPDPNKLKIDSFDPNKPKANLPDSSPPSGNGSSNSPSNVTHADFQVLFGKFLSDIIGQDLPMGDMRDAVKREGAKWAAEGRSAGSKIEPNSSFNTEFDKLSKENQEVLKNFIKQNAHILSGIYRNRINSRVGSLSTNTSTQAAATAYSNEAALAKIDTASLLAHSKFSDSLANSISAISHNFSSVMQSMSSPLQNLAGPAGASSDTITINFNIDKMDGDMNDLKKFNKMMNDELLRRKGIK
ncbi:peptidoglycan DD-metalloendopeptidase family protein [Metasolibacillus meyeri]|uniref:Peptidoglycan DD-metalloendopeptidase family protein n=1 Tax=Metasolibacillus meyeri TaxID=1071052 RepID=A0AAW9NVF2_9BACL|nr:peptidoglycan DD-metalloendopeptidase family protein [Metasolibacillus meyeri]MEC1179191.1 peptidoglycan DD-metalloendopeptidase family protein [Metasolibacillus meyeri]